MKLLFVILILKDLTQSVTKNQMQNGCLHFFQELQFEMGRGQAASILFKLQTKYSTLSQMNCLIHIWGFSVSD